MPCCCWVACRRLMEAADAVDTVEVEIQAWRSTGASLWMPMYLAHLIGAYADLGRFDEAWRCFGEATSLMPTNQRAVVRG